MAKLPMRHDGQGTAINVGDPDVMMVHAVPDRPDGGWVHTHGLAKLGFPEWELRGIQPLFLLKAAVSALNNWADYVVNGGKPVELGQLVDFGGFVCEVVALEPLDATHQGYWTLVPVQAPACEECGKRHGPEEVH